MLFVIRADVDGDARRVTVEVRSGRIVCAKAASGGQQERGSAAGMMLLLLLLTEPPAPVEIVDG